MSSEWYVYMVRCTDGTLYTGITNNIPKRIEKHNTGQGSKYIIKKRRPVVLVGSVSCPSRGSATSLEYNIKSKLNREQKLAFFNKKEEE